jgi:hypothetical protein
LNNETSVIGVGIRWGISKSEPNPTFGTTTVEVPETDLKLASLGVAANASQQVLTVQRNYNDQKFLLRGTLVRLASGLQPSSSYTGSNHFASGVANAPVFATGTTIATYELTVRANTIAAITTRILADLNPATARYFLGAPGYHPVATTSGATVVSSGAAYAGNTVSSAADFELADSLSTDEPSVRYEFVDVPTGYYVVPAVLDTTGTTSGTISTNVLSASGATHYVLMRESGLTLASARMTTGDIFTLTADQVPSAATGVIAKPIANAGLDAVTNGYEEDDVAFLVLDARTGQLAINDSSGFDPAATARQEVTVSIALRVVKSTDANPLTFQVNNASIKHSIVLYKNS